MQDVNKWDQGLKQKSLSVNDYTRFHFFASCDSLVENEQARLGRYMNRLHENIQHMLELPHLTRVKHAFQTASKAEAMLYGKANSALPFIAPNASSATRAPKVGNWKIYFQCGSHGHFVAEGGRL